MALRDEINKGIHEYIGQFYAVDPSHDMCCGVLEPIVRCKDCAYSYIEEENGEFFRCCDYWYNGYSGYGVKDDNFCSQGERWVED